jgi:hypothetical protein
LKRILLIVCLVLIVLYMSFDLYTKPKPEDILIEATLKINDNERLSYLDYMVDLVVHQEKDSQNMIFPFIRGLTNLTFDDKQEEGYFLPGAIWSAGAYEPIVVEALKEQNIINNLESHNAGSMMGVYVPEEAGEYKLRMYLEEAEGFSGLRDMYVVYMHIEERTFLPDIQWTKIVEIKSDVD